MTQTEWVFFDLDGTLVDSGPGIVAGIGKTLTHFNIPFDTAELNQFVGPPLWESFQHFAEVDFEQADVMVRHYWKYSEEKGLFQGTVYEGIPELLTQLQQAGKKLAVATSKKEKYANIVLEHFQLAPFFQIICGSSDQYSHSKKADVVAHALEQIPNPNPKNIVMVGDRLYDVIGAKEHNIDTIGVLYGYGDEPELREAGAKWIAPTPKDVKDIILPQH